MQAALRHRGPNGEGIEIVRDGAAREHPPTLAHTRLSIIELSRLGHQPMFDAPRDQSRNGIVFNGEIYNYQELWGELEDAGFPCKTRSDTEVILNAYRVWGSQAVTRLNGMFAWCLVDTANGVAWLCRDRMGMKPLYLYELQGEGLLFASELRALLQAREFIEPRVNPGALETFLAQGAVMGEDSIVRGVRLLEPAESLTVDLRGRRIRSTKYWQLRFGSEEPKRSDDAPLSRRENAQVVGTALRTAVGSMLVADVPVGVLLSSGVDSTAIATVATEISAAPVRTVTVGFDVAEFDETATAQRVARELQTEHVTLRLDGRRVLSEFDAALSTVDQPTVDGFNTFYSTRTAKDAGVAVALSGLGGDELFGGYATFRDVPRTLTALRALGKGRTLALAARVARLLSQVAPRARAALKLNEALARVPELVTLYCLRRELLLPEQRRRLQDLPAQSDPLTGLPNLMLESLRNAHAKASVLDRIAHLELATYMRHMLLRDADAFSMAQPIELRLPFLEHAVVEAVTSASSRFRRATEPPKPLLLDAVGSRVPKVVTNAKKRGFTFPWDAWLRGPLRAHASSALSAPGVWRDLGVNARATAQLWERFEKREPSAPALAVLGLLVLSDFSRRHQLRI